MKGYIKRSKTDQEDLGSVFHLYASKVEKLSLPGVLWWYLESTELQDTDYLFRGCKGNCKVFVESIGRLVAGYRTSVIRLTNFCKKLNLDKLTMHSGRKCTVMMTLERGLSKTSIKICGGWTLHPFDEYFYPES